MEDTSIRDAGVDWGGAAHAARVIDGRGAVLEQFAVPHSAAGLDELARRLGRAGVTAVAIERPDGPVVEALMDAGCVVVVPSRAVGALRARYGAAGAKDDARDAYLLADTLRTDGHRFAALEPDAPATVTLRAHVRARKDLVAARVAAANRLRAHLALVFPGALGLFHHIDSPISLRFLGRFSSAAAAAWLSERRLSTWLSANGYCGRTGAGELYRRLAEAPGGLLGDEGRAREPVTGALVAVLETLRAQIAQLEARIRELLELHPDGPIFASLPRAGTLRAAALLAEIGDCRARFPSASALAALAGAAPVTRASGRHRAVGFRWAADKKLRDALLDFAGDSRHANAWAAALSARHRGGGKSHPHAERILARAWAGVIWRIWQDRVPYDPARHGALQQLAAVGG
jgi:transposase